MTNRPLFTPPTGDGYGGTKGMGGNGRDVGKGRGREEGEGMWGREEWEGMSGREEGEGMWGRGGDVGCGIVKGCGVGLWRGCEQGRLS